MRCRALTEVFGSHGLPMSLYTDRGAHYFYTPTAGGEVDRSRPTQVGRALERLGRRAYCRIDWSRSWRSKRSTRSKRQTCSCAMSISPNITPGSRSRAAQEGTAFVAIPGVDLAEFYASRRSVRSATIIACRSTGSSCKYRKARCAPISSRRA